MYLNEIADSLKTEALLDDRDPTVPYLDFNEGANQDAIPYRTAQLLDKEQPDAQERKRLQHELRDLKVISLRRLLVDLMECDMQRHIAILRFARKHARRHKY